MSLFVFTTFMAAAVSVDAPITAVTVFSDRARVTRTASVSVEGTGRYDLPLLIDSVDPATIRVEAQGAEVRRVDLGRVEAEEFPVGEARDLIGKLEKVDDQLARLRGDRDAAHALWNAVRGIAPSTPSDEPLRPRVKLNAAGWGSGIAFVSGWMERMQARARDLDEKMTDLARERQQLAEKARILGGARRHAGYRVSTMLAGNGKARVTVSYMAVNARWTPAYEIQLLSDQKRVQVGFAGLVSQETGEDWVDAEFTLSTSVPATTTQYPKVYTWKIGEKERFIPTPSPVVEQTRPPPRAVPPLPLSREADEVRQLLALVLQKQPLLDVKQAEEKEESDKRDESKNAKAAERPEPMGDLDSMTREEAPKGEMAPPPPPSAPMPSAAPTPSYEFQDQSVTAQPSAMPRAPGAYRTSTQSLSEVISSGRSRNPVVTENLGLAPPPSYQPPYYGPDLPVTLAGGYDLTFHSARAETVRSGKGQRRVSLFAQAWPVSVERRVYPALSPEAYLTAEIKNPSPQALPGGTANLFVGDDPAGVAHLNLVSPGEKFTLPLGIDRAIKAEKGLFSKDEISEYSVTTEIANPYRVPIPLRVIDQVPLTDDKNVEIKLLRTSPQPVAQTDEDKVRGALEWMITVPASGKQTVTFVYTVRRPKGWRMHQ